MPLQVSVVTDGRGWSWSTEWSSWEARGWRRCCSKGGCADFADLLCTGESRLAKWTPEKMKKKRMEKRLMKSLVGGSYIIRPLLIVHQESMPCQNLASLLRLRRHPVMLTRRVCTRVTSKNLCQRRRKQRLTASLRYFFIENQVHAHLIFLQQASRTSTYISSDKDEEIVQPSSVKKRPRAVSICILSGISP
jgi:hypothetical protein